MKSIISKFLLNVKLFISAYSTGYLFDFLLIFGLVLILRLPYFSWPLISDEGGYAYTAYWWFQGTPLYSDSLWFDRPQGIFIVYKIGMLLLGGETWSIRLWGSIWAAGTGVFVYLIGRKIEGRKVGLISGILYAIFSVLPQIEGFTANAEVFSQLPATITIWLLLRKQFGWAGFFAALAFVIKPSGVSAGLYSIFWLIYNSSKLKSWLIFCIGFIPLPLLCLFQGSYTAGLHDYLYAIAGFRIELISESPLQRLISGWNSTILFWLPLLIISMINFRFFSKKAQVIGVSWTLTSLIGMSMSAHWNGHYFIQLSAPLTFTATLGIINIINSKFKVKRMLFIILLPSIISVFLFSFISPKTGSWLIFHRIDYIIAEDVAKYVQLHTEGSDKLYVSIASANINYLSHRFSPVPSVFKSFLIYQPNEFSRVINIIEKQEPKYILLVEYPDDKIDPTAEFSTTLNRFYKVDILFDKVPLYIRK